MGRVCYGPSCLVTDRTRAETTLPVIRNTFYCCLISNNFEVEILTTKFNTLKFIYFFKKNTFMNTN